MLENRSWKCWAVGLALCVVGCGSGADDIGAAGAGGSGGGSQLDLPSSLTFETPATLTMIPGEAREVTVVASPARSYPVHFVLLGQFEDASLDRSEATTGEDGRATIQLVAPTVPTTFSLRASVGDSVTAQAGVSVSASGFASLQVEPSYSGKREITGWVASVRAGSTCAELVGNPPPDGDLKSGAVAGQIPQVEGVPIGPVLAVGLRSGYYIYGCKEISKLTPGEINTTVVPVSDVPVKVDETDLLVSLTLDSSSEPWNQTFANTLSEAGMAALGGASDDVSALLEDMQLVTPTTQDATAFDAQSTAADWHGALTAALGGANVAPTIIRDKIAAFMQAGAKNLTGAAFEGSLVSAGKGSGQATFELATIAGMDAETAGFSTTNNASWQSDPGDTVLLGTKLYTIPSMLFTAMALGPAKDAAPTAISVPGALGDLLACDDVAAALVAAGEKPGQSYAGCDGVCTKTLCRAALSAQWERVKQATADSGSPAATLVLSATGLADVDQYARPTSFYGTWVGTVAIGAKKNNVSGSATGSEPPPPK